MRRAILFDLDGTLVDSLEDIAVALDAALGDLGLPLPTRADVRSWIGGGARNLVAQATPPARVDDVLARFRTHYAAAPVAHTRLYEGLAPVLDALAAAGHALAVLTNKPHDLALQICDPLLARWPFAAIVGAQTGVPLKPDPAAALVLSKRLGVAPDRCAMVGDSAIDIEMAHAAGMRAIAVTWGFRPRAELEAARPALLVDSPEGLRALVSAT
ncbi:MAG: Phosphoglycolate phosphatase [Myxococcales bacterium]|nr:Phosphoglycolate phosphatase [Myxococcales bacterium]